MTVTFENNVFVKVRIVKGDQENRIGPVQYPKSLKEGMAFETRCSASEFCDLEERAPTTNGDSGSQRKKCGVLPSGLRTDAHSCITVFHEQ